MPFVSRGREARKKEFLSTLQPLLGKRSPQDFNGKKRKGLPMDKRTREIIEACKIHGIKLKRSDIDKLETQCKPRRMMGPGALLSLINSLNDCKTVDDGFPDWVCFDELISILNELWEARMDLSRLRVREMRDRDEKRQTLALWDKEARMRSYLCLNDKNKDRGKTEQDTGMGL